MKPGRSSGPLAFDRFGTLGRPLVVLLHGWACDGEDMRALATALADEFEVLVPDLPGHGGSVGRGGAATIEGMAESVLAMLAGHTEPALLVGHSMGGAVALDAAVLAPHWVSGVVTLDANWAWRPATIVAPDSVVSAEDRRAAIVTQRKALGVTSSRAPADCEALVHSMQSLVDWAAAGPHVLTGLPVRAVFGERGWASIPELPAGVDRRDVVVLGNCGHWLQIERTAEVEAVVRDVITGRRRQLRENH